MFLRKKIVNQMQAWIEKNEADGSHKEIIDIYNNHKPLARGYKVKYNDSWCAVTVSAAAIACGYTEIIPTECSCQRMIELAAKMGIWVENDAYTPRPGDIILYDWQDSGKGDDTGWADHIGIVETCDGRNIVVIEGNYHDAVGRRQVTVNGRYIRGYITPKYDEEPAKEPEASAPTNTEYYPQYVGNTNSIADALKSLNINSTFVYRKKIAAKNGITNYAGTAKQNIKMLELLKNGKLIKAEASAPTNTEYYPKYAGNTNSIVDALKSLNINSTFAYRKEIAAKNGITLYIGSAKQNAKMLELLKSGKLIKA